MLPLRVSSAAKARAVVREFLVGAGPGVDLDGAVLVVSELVSNAVRHASGSPADLKLEIAVMPGCMRIEVADPDPRPPVVYAGGPHDECGRGLRIVDRLARCWGWEPVGGSGKRIWCELAEPPWSARRG